MVSLMVIISSHGVFKSVARPITSKKPPNICQVIQAAVNELHPQTLGWSQKNPNERGHLTIPKRSRIESPGGCVFSLRCPKCIIFWHSDTFLLGLTRHLKKWAVGRAVSRATWVKSHSISVLSIPPPNCVLFPGVFFVAVGGELIAPTSKWLSHDAKVAAGKEAPERFAHVDIEKCTHSQQHQKHHPATFGQATRVTETQSKRFDVEPRDPTKTDYGGYCP